MRPDSVRASGSNSAANQASHKVSSEREVSATKRGSCLLRRSENRGGPPDSVELTVDLAANLDKQDVLMAIERIAAHVVESGWPPA